MDQRATLYNLVNRCIANGTIKRTGESKPLCEIAPGTEFLLNNQYCKMKVSNKSYCSWSAIDLSEHATTRTEQIGYMFNWVFSDEVSKC